MARLGKIARPKEEVDMEQAGRTKAHLAAERHTALLHSRSSSLQHIDRREHLLDPQSKTSYKKELERKLAELAVMRREESNKTESSPFKTESESSSLGADATNGDLSLLNPASSREVSSGSYHIPGAYLKSERDLTPQHSLRQSSPERSSQIGTPKSLKDLGRDYSRYPPSKPITRANSVLPRQRPSITKYAGSDPTLPHFPPGPAPRNDQAALERCGYPDDGVGAFNPYFGGEKGFILYDGEVEEDDDQHMPADNDDRTFRPKLSDFLHRKTLGSCLGGTLMILGFFALFILLPILTYASKHGGIAALTVDPGKRPEVIDYGPAWAHVNNRTYPLVENVRRGLIDPDTPKSAYTRKSTFDKSVLRLVFSDEFNKPNRTFYPGDDPYWTAPDIWYGATQDLEWYDPDAATTANGTLQLKLDWFPNHNLTFRSGMLNSWNQMCFKGGIFEVSVSLAGPAGVPGLWPGAWAMGNLGRPGYLATTDGVWPYTYNSCDIGITPNQSSPDGLSQLPGQKLSSCTCAGQDHPSLGTGRGAPEIDILEGSVDSTNLIGVVTQSFQVAPFDIWYRPNSDFLQIPNYNTTQMNGYCGGPFQQAVSGTTLLNNNWYDGKQYQKYAFEYIPGTNKGKLAWFVGEDQTFMMDGRAIGRNGNIAARQVSEEPMSLILNLGISNSWSEIRWPQLTFPTVMHVDYVRIYQKPGQEMITCDPPGYPTTEYIKNHPNAYRNANLTVRHTLL